VTVTNSTTRGNFAGNGGNCCSATENGGGSIGGGLYNDGGTLTVVNSTIAGNAGGDGGGNGGGFGGSDSGVCDRGGVLIVTNSTVSGNVTGNGNPSGKIGASGFGGGISVGNATLTMSNTTLTANSTGDGFSGLSSSGGAIAVDTGALTVTNSTIASNTVGNNGSAGGSFAHSSSVLLKNTLLVANGGGTPASGSTHKMADGSGCGATFTQETAAQIDLDPLLNNGGPTLTMALRFPSAAIDAGENVSCPAADQRGMPRLRGLSCDIGAYEFQAVWT
jgi:hypothetical protein